MGKGLSDSAHFLSGYTAIELSMWLQDLKEEYKNSPTLNLRLAKKIKAVERIRDRFFQKFQDSL